MKRNGNTQNGSGIYKHDTSISTTNKKTYCKILNYILLHIELSTITVCAGYELTVRTSHFAKKSFYFRKKCETNYAKKRKIAKLEVQYIFFLTYV